LKTLSPGYSRHTDNITLDDNIITDNGSSSVQDDASNAILRTNSISGNAFGENSSGYFSESRTMILVK